MLFSKSVNEEIIPLELHVHSIYNHVEPNFFVPMPVTLILGTQWGDEGKGKIIDTLSTSADFVVRFQGGNNAGHTVINNYGTFKMHLLPSGIFSLQTTAFITNGVVLDLPTLISEIEMLEKAGIDLKDRFFISPRCHLIMPYHKLLDGLYEAAKGDGKTGTTGRGIGPVHADKVSYNGIRVSDLLNPEGFKTKLTTQLAVKNKILIALSEKALQADAIISEFEKYKEKIVPYVKEPYPLLAQAVDENKNILLEGAQAVFLDNDWGTYPFVTASTVVAGGVTAYAGIPPQKLTEIIGVAKAYITRVGTGPFPTELEDSIGENIRKIGAEYGATTGRARRCGWFDAELVRFAVRLNGITSIALTKLDVLDEFETIKICTGYELNGKKVSYYDGDDVFLEKVKPVYQTIPGWKTSTKGIRTYEDLPQKAKEYIEELEKQIGCKISSVSTGPSREEIIYR